MKKVIPFLIVAVGLAIFQIACDKIDQPSIIITELDTNLFPGNFIDYQDPVFEENTNTLRNVLIEDFTGHKCGFCPPAAELAAQLETANPGRVFVASIHASPTPGGVSNFQEVSLTGNKYLRDFTTPEGKEIAVHLSGGGTFPNPIGTINRLLDGNNQLLLSAGVWSNFTDSVLNNPATFPLDVNLQAKSNYYPSTNGIFIHVEAEFLKDMSGEYAVAVYALENKIIDWQLYGADNVEDYEHHNVHIGNVFEGESFGRVLVNGEVDSGRKFYQTFSYKIPDGLDGSKMHFQIYVYDKATDEILQVIEHRFQ